MPEVRESVYDSTESNASSSVDENYVCESVINRKPSISLQQVKRFMVDGNAFEDLREGLMGFVIPLLLAAQKTAFPSAILNEQKESQSSESIADEAVDNAERTKVLAALFIASSHKYPLINRLLEFHELISEYTMNDMKHTENSHSLKYFGRKEWSSTLLKIRAVLEILELEIEKELTKKLQERYQHKGDQERMDQKENLAPISPLGTLPGQLKPNSFTVAPETMETYRVDVYKDCGEDLWDDLHDSNPKALAVLAAILHCPLTNTYTNLTQDQLQSHHSCTKAEPSAGARTSQNFDGSLASTPNSPRLAVSTGMASSAKGIGKYMELCINTGEYDISLVEIAISTSLSSVTSDSQLFEEIRKKYNQHRGFLRSHNLNLFKPVRVNFVQFCIEDGDVGILKTPLSFPLEENIKSKEWGFCSCPCPLKDPPPSPTNIFLHYFNSNRTHPRRTWLNRPPKKLNHSIHQTPDPDSTHIGWQAHGWGIHIIEGPNGKAMLWLTFVIVAASLAATLSWAFVKKDVQGACGIGGCMLAAATALMFAFFTYYQPPPYPRSG